MNSLLVIASGAFLLSLVLTPVVRDIFRVFDVVDRPDAGRKTHPFPIPRVGGIAIGISYILISYLAPANPETAGLSLAIKFLPSICIIFTTGLIDDFVGLKPGYKLASEVVAAGIAYWLGARIGSVAGQPTIGWLSLLLTVAWLVACANAFNLIDGLDGLAAGIGLVSTLTIFAGALLEQNTALCFATLPLAACLAAFLCFNFNPATIFLGDCGSLTIGFLLGCYGIIWSQKSLTMFSMAAPLIALAVPLIDIGLSVLRRLLRGQPIFSADRGHIHHRLIDRGLSPRRVVLMIYGVCGISAALALVQRYTRSSLIAVVVGGMVLVVIWVGIGYLRYSEFTLVGRLFRGKTIQEAVGGRLLLEQFVAESMAAASAEERWQVIRTHYRKFGFAGARLRDAGVEYQEWPGEDDEPGHWIARIPLGGDSFIEFAREFGGDEIHAIVAPLANAIHRSFGGGFLQSVAKSAKRTSAS